MTTNDLFNNVKFNRFFDSLMLIMSLEKINNSQFFR